MQSESNLLHSGNDFFPSNRTKSFSKEKLHRQDWSCRNLLRCIQKYKRNFNTINAIYRNRNILYIAATPQLCSVASPADIASLAPDPSELPGSAADLSSVYDVICRVSQAAEEVCILYFVYFIFFTRSHTRTMCTYARTHTTFISRPMIESM